MSDRLPEELLREVLASALSVSTEEFCSFSTAATFVSSGCSSISDILLVSKRWLRVGTPLLYETVVIRTSAQIRSLSRAMRKVACLGPSIHKLRLEGGYEQSLIPVVKGAPNIRIFHLSLNITSGQSVKGLCAILPLINPSRFVFNTMRPESRTKNIREVESAIALSVPQWSALERVDIADEISASNPAWLIEALGKTTRLQCIEVGRYFFGSLGSQGISRISSLKTLIIRGNIAPHISRALRDLPSSVEVRYDDTAESQIVYEFDLLLGFVPIPVYNKPLTTIPVLLPGDLHESISDSIWSRIFAFATHVHHPDDYQFNDSLQIHSLHQNVNVTRRSLMLVSKRFYRLSLPYLYSIPVFGKVTSRHAFAIRIKESPDLAPLVHVLDGTSTSFFLFTGILSGVILSAPFINLKHLHQAFRVFPHAFEEFKEMSMSTLLTLDQDLYDNRPEYPVFIPPLLFATFPLLQELTLHGGCTIIEDGEIPEDAMPNLWKLDISDCGQTLIQLFTRMRLPSLKKASIWSYSSEPPVWAFLRHHGHKLTHADVYWIEAMERHRLLDVCPNLVELNVTGTILPINLWLLTPGSKNHSLKKLILSNSVSSKMSPADAPYWDMFISNISLPDLTALEEIQLPRSFHWPSSLKEAKKSLWAPRVKALRDLGVALSDGEGNKWTRVL